MASHEMFSYLTEGSSKTSSLDTLKEFARGAAYSFLGNDKTPLNFSIEKTASANGLTPDEVSIVCQEANKEVHAQLFKNSENKYVEFDLADPQQIIGNLEGSDKVAHLHSIKGYGLNFGSEKTASFNTKGVSEFDLTPSEVESLNTPKFNDGTQITKQAGDSNLYFKPEHVKKASMMKKQADLKRLEDDITAINFKLDSEVKNFVKIARNTIMGQHLTERPQYFPYVAKFCKVAGMDQPTIETLLDLTKKVMVQQNLLEKTADIKADPELISENLDARVINGNHPLEITVKTIVDLKNQKESRQNSINLIKTDVAEAEHNDHVEGGILGKKVREL